MRHQDIEVGAEYLTRDVRRVSRSYRRLDLTRGHVRVEEGPMLTRRGERRWKVTWLMRNGTERTDPTLPRWLTARRFLVEVKR